MKSRTQSVRGALMVLVVVWLTGCDDTTDRINAPHDPQYGSNANPEQVRAAMAAQERHTPALLAVSGVVGTAVGLAADGRAVVQVFIAHPNVYALPLVVDGVPLTRVVTGEFHALSNPTTRARPAPVGFSIGHPLITAGTFGARVRDGAGNLFMLSNNHVLANKNAASIGDATLQPGAFDGGVDPADRIATLYAFEPINFSGANNVMDAAIAITTAAATSNSTPTDDGYGTPSARLYNDANDDLTFDSLPAALNLLVQKYGRTTKLTKGIISGINGIVDVCYEQVFIFCAKSAHFVDQLIITPGTFSSGGDSGSMIVSDDANKFPIGLLFAGSSANTIANRMDHVLRRFNVRVDGAGSTPPPPPPPLPANDLALTAVNAPASVTQGDVVSVGVTVQNTGTNALGSDITLTLTDVNDAQVIGTAVITGGLAAGAVASRNIAWNTAGESTGAHTISARHNITDDVASNNTRSTTVNVDAPVTVGLHFGDLDGSAIAQSGGKWLARVTMTAHGMNHEVLVGASAGGIWSDGVEFTCTTNAAGQCVAQRSLRKQTARITFTVAGIVYGLTPFTPEFDHDPDGSSDGTQITVNRP